MRAILGEVILGIETSCDETSAAVVSGGRACHSNIVASQVELHKLYGGVVPEIASRRHVELLVAVVDEALAEAGVGLAQVDAIAVTNGPGLVGALLVGLSYAKALAYAANKPLIAVDHIEAHICSSYVENAAWEPPFVALVVSGGHTLLAYVAPDGAYEVLGKTMDDAAGEAFDKVARTLGLGYPGGPALEHAAIWGDPTSIKFPRAMQGTLDFSFSGLKSAVVNFCAASRARGEDISVSDIAASFQAAVVDVLVGKSVAACQQLGVGRLALVGGVAASSALRQELGAACAEMGISLNVPPKELCTDNAAMVAAAAHKMYLGKDFAKLDTNAYSSSKF